MLRHLRWLTILSLDAPWVTVLWQLLLAKSFEENLGFHHVALVFASIWLGYSADRFFDALRPAGQRSERHAWHQKSRGKLVTIWAATLLAALVAAFATLSANELKRGFLLCGASLLYTVFAQKARRWPHYGTIKAAAVSLLVCLAAALYAVPWSDMTLARLHCLAPISLLFFLNCLSIRRWEQADKSPPSSIERACIAGVALECGLLALHYPIIALATAASGLGLLALDKPASRDLSFESARVLGDLCLCSPLLILPFA